MDKTTAPTYHDHSKKFQQMVSRAERYGELDKPDGYGKRTGDCGDTIEMYLSIQAGQVRMVTFRVEGCANTVACGNTVSILIEGRTLSDAWKLTPENVSDYLETLPPDHFHCAELAVGAFYKALTNYNRRKKEAWKTDYPHR